jgi:hypothetical protein
MNCLYQHQSMLIHCCPVRNSDDINWPIEVYTFQMTRDARITPPGFCFVEIPR